MSKTELEHLEEMITLKFSEREKALELQAKEYDRRLEHLNGEATKLTRMQATYIPREVYEANKKENDDKIAALQRVVYIATGAIIVLEVLMKYILK